MDEDLLHTEGLDFQRDIAVFVCKGDINAKFVVRAWVRPKDGQWREIRIGELTQDRRANLISIEGVDPETALVIPGVLRVTSLSETDAGLGLVHLTIPVRKEGLGIGDSVRVEVRTDCDTEPFFPVCNQEVLNEFLTIDRYGLLPGFSDSVLFVKRLEMSPAAVANGIDSANYRPSPGLNFGLTYLHRKHPFVQFLEPGFGFNVSLLSWKDNVDVADKLVTPPSEAIQLGIGAMGSMFDNVMTVVYGWNTNVAHDREYLGVGFSVMGVVRKVARTTR